MDGCDVRAEAEAILLRVGPGHRAMVSTSWESGDFPDINRNQRITHGQHWYQVILAGLYVHSAFSESRDAVIVLIFHEPGDRQHNREWARDKDGNWSSKRYA